MPTESEIIDRCTDDDLDLIRLLYVGNDGVTRGYAVNADRVGSLFDDGMNLSKGMQSFNALDHLSPTGPFGPVGSVRLLADPETFTELPYADGSAAMLSTMEITKGDTWAADPRSTLIQFLEDAPYSPSVAFESEFYLVKHTEEGEMVPAENSVCFSPDGMQAVNDFVLDLKHSLTAQDIEFEAYYPEYGPGQQEVVVGHEPGVQAADNHVYFKQTVKGVAYNCGYDVTFVPKPFGDAAGSGCHVHLSLWDGDENVFYDSGAEDQAYAISETGRQFIAGVLDHAKSLIALTAPTVLSYERLQPHMWASAFTCWGIDNREAVVRIPFASTDSPEGSTRFEFKPADNTANPYLVLLSLMAAGMDGIERSLDPGDPVQTDPATLSATEQAERNVERLPETLGEALDELTTDEVLAKALGEPLFESYLDTKRSEWNEYTDSTTNWELDSLTRAF